MDMQQMAATLDDYAVRFECMQAEHAALKTDGERLRALLDEAG